ncbi:MAG: hypothetical protein J0H42_05055 [Rhizobiales bacterium]|nr:hypothetical protein [Hyphomicrobiales bacterium]
MFQDGFAIPDKGFRSRQCVLGWTWPGRSRATFFGGTDDEAIGAVPPCELALRQHWAKLHGVESRDGRGSGSSGSGGSGHMKRLLIFAVLFPPLALVVFNAPDMITRHDFRLMDSSSFQMVYAIAVIPALLLAWVDWALSAKPTRLRVMGTAGTAALAAVLIVRFLSGGSDELWPVLMVGLVGGVPAAVCSWLSDKSMRSANA